MAGPQNCFICTAKFGFFKKQVDCINCNKTTCKECQNYMMVVPSKGSQPQNVCKQCFQASKNKSSRRVSPPRNFKRELEKRREAEEKKEKKELESPEDQSIRERLEKLRSEPVKNDTERRDISVDEIKTRLEKLCTTDRTITDEEIEYRLGKLKGSRPPAIRVHSIRKRPIDQPQSSKEDQSEYSQAKKLIRQFTQEIAMETDDVDSAESSANNIPENPSTDDLIALAVAEIHREEQQMKDEGMTETEISRRLSQLHDLPDVELDEATGMDFDDIDPKSAELIKQIMAEDRLEQSLGYIPNTQSISEVTPKPEPENEEFPWCMLCNDDAIVRCLTCERELFCRNCYKEIHKDSDMKGHKTEKYESKNKDI
nr:abscission/NoCut checkpoint regulator [Ciona intestinalis]|eukprot:XP_009860645.1 abscission/NoCut checkpoint regulator [Ciona intestinalis]